MGCSSPEARARGRRRPAISGVDVAATQNTAIAIGTSAQIQVAQLRCPSRATSAPFPPECLGLRLVYAIGEFDQTSVRDRVANFTRNMASGRPVSVAESRYAVFTVFQPRPHGGVNRKGGVCRSINAA